MQLDIITPEKILVSTPIQMAVIPGSLGDFGVLPGHMPFISTIRPGVISVTAEDGSESKLAILGGIAEVVPERCTVLAETAVGTDGINAEYVRAKIKFAEEVRQASATDEARIEAEKHEAFAEALKFLLGEPVFE